MLERKGYPKCLAQKGTINQESSLARYDASRVVDPMDRGKNADHRGEQS